MKDLVIDIHAHYIPSMLYERFDDNSAKFPEVKLLRDEKGIRMQFPGGQPTRPISPKLSDLADRRAWMDKNGIDHQLVGGWLDSFGYELPAHGAASTTTASRRSSPTRRASRRSRPCRCSTAASRPRCCPR